MWVTNERWEQHHAPPQWHATFQCTAASVAPKDVNRLAVVAHTCKGFANEVSVGLATVLGPFNLLVSTLWRYCELGIGSLGRFVPFFNPFSAFDVLVGAVNHDDGGNL